MATAEVEETLKRIQSHKGVHGVIIVNSEGIPVRSTLDNSTTVQYAHLVHGLALRARCAVKDIDPTNELKFVRVKSLKNEILCAPGGYTKDKGYLLICIQQNEET